MCALLVPVVGMAGIGAVEQPLVLIPGPNSGLAGITQAKATADQEYADSLKGNDDAGFSREFAVPRDGIRHLATVGVDNGFTSSADPVAALNLVGLRVPELKQLLETAGFVHSQGSGTGDIVPIQSQVEGTQIPSAKVNVAQPDPEDPGGSGGSGQSEDSSQSDDSSQSGDSSLEEGSSQPEVSNQPEIPSQQVDEGGTHDRVRYVTVPDLEGLSKTGASQQLNAEDLVLGEVLGEGDRVVGLHPIAGTMVLPESEVDVDMGSEETIYVVVPDLVGSTV